MGASRLYTVPQEQNNSANAKNNARKESAWDLAEDKINKIYLG
jgi:hypothetical protein